MNATIKAVTAPISTDPMKIKKNRPIAYRISSPKVYPFIPSDKTVVYITIATASLKIDSPNTIAYRFSSASISLKTARTETGSVAEIKLPKAKASFHENVGLTDV